MSRARVMGGILIYGAIYGDSEMRVLLRVDLHNVVDDVY